MDVFGTDLRLILRNIIRNAIQALARTQAPRRLAVDVAVELEPTGEETVVFRVRDSSPEDVICPEVTGPVHETPVQQPAAAPPSAKRAPSRLRTQPPRPPHKPSPIKPACDGSDPLCGIDIKQLGP